MSEIVKLRTQAEIDDEAAAWTWRLDGEALSAADRQAFEAWLRRDPRHRRSFDDFGKVWGALDNLAEAKRDEKIATFTGASRRSVVRRNLWWGAVAATLVAALVGVVSMRQSAAVQTIATAVGQQRLVTLADGSVVTLNTNTIVEANLGRIRNVYLRKGEAHFEVAHDRSRPFLVHAGDTVVRAVGTAFAVRLRAGQNVDVVVAEGRVEVQSPAAPDAATDPSQARTLKSRALSAGQRLSIGVGDETVIPVSATELANQMAWRQGAIVFQEEPLSQAVAEIERYTDSRIVVSDPRIAALRVGGRFRTDDLQGFFDALQTALPVAIRHTSDGLVYVDPQH